MDERELVGLVYRADWSQLTLAGTVRGANGSLLAMFGGDRRTGGERREPGARPPFVTPGLISGDLTLRVAPGLRFRVDAADGQWAGGCDGARAWQWRPAPPTDAQARFGGRPRPPVPALLAPSWLLSGHALTVEGTATACGRAGVLVSATAAEDMAGRDALGGSKHRWPGGTYYDRAVVVVDAALGLVLRCEFHLPGREPEVTEFTGLTVGGPVDPAVFAAPGGSLTGDPSSWGDVPVLDDILGPVLGRAGLEAVKTAGGLAAGGLGLLIRYAPGRRATPTGRADAEQAEDADAAMPAEELPDWAIRSNGPSGAAAGTLARDMAGPPVGNRLLHLLYRGGAEAAPFTATVHEWDDLAPMLAAAREGTQPHGLRAGFDGVGYLVDAARRRAEETPIPVTRRRRALRFGGWQRYRIDTLDSGRSARRYPDRATPVTVACDGSRTRWLYVNRVEVFDPRELDEEFADLIDGSWLLDCRLSGGEEVTADGRKGYLVIATPRPDDVPPRSRDRLAGAWLPAVAVVDAATGRLLRLTRYVNGRPARRIEFRSLADGADGDFRVRPEGLPVQDHSMATLLATQEDPASVGPDGVGFSGINPLDQIPGMVGDAVRHSVDDAVESARDFLGMLWRGRPPSR